MNKLDFLNEMDRVLAFYQRPDEEKQPGEFKDYGTWLDEIYKKVSWISTIQFRLVVDGLLDVRPRYRKDLDHRRILAVYNDLAERNGWKRATERNCPDCRGVRFVDVWLRDKKGVEFKAVKGCSNCNPRSAGVHADFTQIDQPTEAIPVIDLEKLRHIPPSFASFLLSVAERTEPQPREDIVAALVDATCQPDAGRRSGSQPEIKTIAEPIKNPVKQRNEMVAALLESPEQKGEAERELPAGTPPSGGSSPPPEPNREYTEEDLKDVVF